MGLKIASFVISCFLMFLAYSFSIGAQGVIEEHIRMHFADFLFGRFLFHVIVSNILTLLGYLFVWIYTNADNAAMPATFKQYYIQSQVVYVVFFVFHLVWFVMMNLR